MKGYHDLTRYPEARQIEGLILFRWDAPLFFANAELFRTEIEGAVAEAATPTRWVVVAAEPVTEIDMTAADMLAELDRVDWPPPGSSLRFAETEGPHQGPAQAVRPIEVLGANAFFPTVGAAVDGYIDETGIDWVDWEERAP